APVDAVLCIVDSSNLERNLYLVSQVLELGLPTVVALNMLDLAKQQGVCVHVERLAEQLPVPVVAMQANRGVGIAEVKAALAQVVGEARRSETSPFPQVFEDEVTRLQSLLTERPTAADEPASVPRYLVRRLLLDVDGYVQTTLKANGGGQIGVEIEAARARLAEAGCAVPRVETKVRYGWTRQVLNSVVETPAEYEATLSDRIDRLLTHRFFGTVIFVAVMIAVFQSVFSGAEPFMEWIRSTFAALGGWVETWMAEGVFRSLLVNGVIGGVGGVIMFLPQIFILFLFIAVLEDCGYMARAAYLMDRMMVRVGLSGKSFIPMLASCACAVPGIMAARVIENERDRLTTILVAPLMTCSARLPIYTLLIGAFIPAEAYFGVLSLQGLTLLGLYALGIGSAVTAALIFKRTILRGQAPPFVMELPAYQWPSLRTILFRVAERGVLFLRTAGTIILAASIIVWAALYYPHDAAKVETEPEVQRLRTELASMETGAPERETVARDLDHAVAGAYQRQSYLGRAGRTVEPVFRPLGWDWRISCAVLASFPAREVVVATLGVVYNLGEDFDPDSAEQFNTLQNATWDDTGLPVFTVPAALSIMVFFALCAQCAATLAVIRRETNSWRWPVFTFGYMTVLAYLGALVTYLPGLADSTLADLEEALRLLALQPMRRPAGRRPTDLDRSTAESPKSLTAGRIPRAAEPANASPG
ncbi:MAG: ferrous iron transport protein B, partial [Planctomycetota bacterium]